MNLLTSGMSGFDPFAPNQGAIQPTSASGVPLSSSPASKPLTLPYKMNTILDTRAKQLVNIDNLISNPTPG